MSVDHLLPANAAPFERALSQSMGKFAPARIVAELWNPDTCPVVVLPFLAAALSVDEWDDLWPVEMKRAVIKEARLIHQRKGTPSAVRLVLSSVGHPDAVLTERSDYIRCDGSVTCDGTLRCGGEWATMRVKLLRPITVPDAYRVKRMIGRSKRNAVWLESIDFSGSAFRCDGTIPCDGSVSCGTVDTTIT